MIMIIQGLTLGIIMVLPGMSGGTVLLIFGIYEQVIRDIARLNLKPYIPLGFGILLGLYIGGLVFTAFFQSHRDATVAFLLGLLLASIKPVIENSPKPNRYGVVAAFIGLYLGLLLVDESIGAVAININTNWFVLLIGGGLSSAAMLVPGIPGSAILIILGIYDSMLYYIASLALINLAIFGIGSILGVLLLANAINSLYVNHRSIVSYFFAGLILGSSRSLLPNYFDPLFIILFLIGFIFVWKFSSKNKKFPT